MVAKGGGPKGAVLSYGNSSRRTLFDLRSCEPSFIEDLWQGCGQRWQVVLTRVPDDRWIDLIITVDDSVSHAGHQRPRNLGMRLDDTVGDVASRFADNGQVRDDRLDGLGVG